MYARNPGRFSATTQSSPGLRAYPRPELADLRALLRPESLLMNRSESALRAQLPPTGRPRSATSVVLRRTWTPTTQASPPAYLPLNRPPVGAPGAGDPTRSLTAMNRLPNPPHFRSPPRRPP